jgi:hypothetical protein
MQAIHHKVTPQSQRRPVLIDDVVFKSLSWENVENAAQFWKLYPKKAQGTVRSVN